MNLTGFASRLCLLRNVWTSNKASQYFCSMKNISFYKANCLSQDFCNTNQVLFYRLHHRSSELMSKKHRKVQQQVCAQYDLYFCVYVILNFSLRYTRLMRYSKARNGFQIYWQYKLQVLSSGAAEM